MTTPTKGKRGGFFVIEQRPFHAACALGMRPAVALLVMASFSDRAGTLTRASANAIEKRTEIGRKAAHDAIDELERAGLVRQVGTRARPRYTIAREADLPDPRGALTEKHASALARAIKGEKLTRSDSSLLSVMERGGWVRYRGDGYEPILREPGEPIWLPNELVNGVNGAPSPVERIRQTGDPMMLRLLIDLYLAHRLDEWYGVDPRLLWEEFDEVYRCGVGAVFVLAWRPSASGRRQAKTEDPIVAAHADAERPEQPWDAFLCRVQTLTDLGLLEFFPHVVDGDGGVVYPCVQSNWSRMERGLPMERELGATARMAASNILDSGGAGPFPHNAIVAIVPRHMGTAKLVGIARLAFRPKTAMTAAWYSSLVENCAKWTKFFQEREYGTKGIAVPRTA